MAVKKLSQKSSSENPSENQDFLTTVAKAVGQVAGKAAKTMGLEHSAAGVRAPSRSKGRAKPPNRPSTRARRKTQAEELKSKAKGLLSKGSASPGAPYHRTMGKPAANWSDKDIDYVRGLLAKQSA